MAGPVIAPGMAFRSGQIFSSLETAVSAENTRRLNQWMCSWFSSASVYICVKQQPVGILQILYGVEGENFGNQNWNYNFKQMHECELQVCLVIKLVFTFSWWMTHPAIECRVHQYTVSWLFLIVGWLSQCLIVGLLPRSVVSCVFFKVRGMEIEVGKERGQTISETFWKYLGVHVCEVLKARM